MWSKLMLDLRGTHCCSYMQCHCSHVPPAMDLQCPACVLLAYLGPSMASMHCPPLACLTLFCDVMWQGLSEDLVTRTQGHTRPHRATTQGPMAFNPQCLTSPWPFSKPNCLLNYLTNYNPWKAWHNQINTAHILGFLWTRTLKVSRPFNSAF